MRKLAPAALVGLAMVSLASIPAQASAEDFYTEVLEWVVEPCMEVAAALSVKEYDEDALEMGIKRSHIAEIMTASREAATREMAGKMRASAPWSARRAAYPIMLQVCLAQFLDE